jgi:hypothetical protein
MPGLALTVVHCVAAQDFDVAAAYNELTTRVTANRLAWYVYQDQDVGFNHGFPSGFFGAIDRIHLNAACIDDPLASDGCSSDPNRLDTARGTVLRVSFDPIPEGLFAGLNIEEPEDWGVTQTGRGYDLTGVINDVFDARAPVGSSIQFGVRGCVSDFVPLSQSWMTITLPLSSLTCLPMADDVTSVHRLFGIAVDDVHAANGSLVLLDNIRFTPVPIAHQAALGFPVSTQTFGVLPRQYPDSARPAFPFPSDQVNRNVTAIYESSLTTLALLHRGLPMDLTNSQLLADTFDYALSHDNHGDPLPTAPDGSTGAHKAYENGDIGLYNDQPPPEICPAGDVRLAGFTAATDFCPPSGYCLVLDGATGGNSAFAVLALVAAYRRVGVVRYLNDARAIGNWIVNLLTDTTGTGYGGYYLGYPDMGLPKDLIESKSVENNADIFFGLHRACSGAVGDPIEAALWTARASVAGDFVIQMFDATNGRFNVSTVPVGTPPGSGICPDGSQMGADVINTCDFIDANTFTTLALAGSSRYHDQLDWRAPVQFVLNQFPQSVTAAGRTYAGFDLVPTPIDGAPGVGCEFTAQAIVAMRYVDALYSQTTFEAVAQSYLDEFGQAQRFAPFGDELGLVDSTLQAGDLLTPLFQCLGTPFQCIPERIGLTATVWGILAFLNINPLATGQ